jgi:hypothetical protein
MLNNLNLINAEHEQIFISVLNHFITAYRNDPTQVIEEVKSVLAFNSLLTVLSKHPQGDRFACGLGPISLGNVVCFQIEMSMR